MWNLSIKRGYLTGYTAGAIQTVYTNVSQSGTISGTTQTGVKDLFVAKLQGSIGTVSWLKQLGATGATGATVRAFSVAVDSASNAYVTGSTSGGLGGNTQQGATDWYVAKYTSGGSLSSVSQFGSSGASASGGFIAVDSADNILVTGSTNTGLNGNTLVGAQDLFLAKLTGTGTISWLKQKGVSQHKSNPLGLATDPYLNIFVSGYMTGGLDGVPLVGNQEGVLLKYDTSGVQQ